MIRHKRRIYERILSICASHGYENAVELYNSIYGKKYNSISNFGLWWLSPPPRMDLFQH